MTVELKKNEYIHIRNLVNPLKFHLGLNAIIESEIPGRIWVDKVNNPKSALIWDLRYAYYLVGREDNKEFNIALKKLFTEEIAPDALKRGINQYFLVCSVTWKTKILEEEVIAKKLDLSTIPRCYYILNTFQKYDWKKQIPPNFQMKFVDDQLLRKKNLMNFSTLLIEIEDIAGTAEEFLKKGNFGFCLVYNKKEIVSWCLSFLIGQSCEAWVQTIEKYQKKGFATLSVAAFVDYCQSNHITIGWHSNLNNHGSIKLAEKIGFKRTLEEYSWVIGDFET